MTISSVSIFQEISPLEITLDSLPNEVLTKIFDTLEGVASLKNIRLVSKRFKFITDELIEEKIRLFSKISLYVPRSLSDEEKKLPCLHQLCIAVQLIAKPDLSGITPLIKATLAVKTKRDALQSINILYNLGADINQTCSRGKTAAYYAMYWNIDSAGALLEKLKNSR